MKTASITEAKNNLSALIDGLPGGPVMILDRGRPVARLDTVVDDRDVPNDARAAELIRSGLATAPTRRLPKDFWSKPAPSFPGGERLLEILLQEREEGR